MNKKELIRRLDICLIEGYISPNDMRHLLSLMDEKESGGSDATSEHGDLHSVRGSHASGEDSNTEASVNGSLEKITHKREHCQCEECGREIVITKSWSCYGDD